MAELFKLINKCFEFCFYASPWFVIYVIISKTVETTESQNVSNNDIKAKTSKLFALQEFLPFCL